jgi:hypothetical protein
MTLSFQQLSNCRMIFFQDGEGVIFKLFSKKIKMSNSIARQSTLIYKGPWPDYALTKSLT